MPHADPLARKAFRKQYRQRRPELHARWLLKHRYGLTVEELRQLFENQEGLCAICSKSICICAYGGSKTCSAKACVDHCHETDEVRGLLCFRCNTGLGHFEESTRGLRNAISYLETCPNG